jgi:hypothetical protein
MLNTKKPATDPSLLEGLVAGSGNLSTVLDNQCTPTAHHPTVPPSGERAVIVVAIIWAVVRFNHSFRGNILAGQNKQSPLKSSSIQCRLVLVHERGCH